MGTALARESDRGITPLPQIATRASLLQARSGERERGGDRAERQHHVGDHVEQRDALLADIPAGEFGDPADFGAAAAFLCSEQAGFITGTSLVVDGGASRGLL